jgi:hypothetical protein
VSGIGFALVAAFAAFAAGGWMALGGFEARRYARAHTGIALMLGAAIVLLGQS